MEQTIFYQCAELAWLAVRELSYAVPPSTLQELAEMIMTDLDKVRNFVVSSWLPERNCIDRMTFKTFDNMVITDGHLRGLTVRCGCRSIPLKVEFNISSKSDSLKRKEIEIDVAERGHSHCSQTVRKPRLVYNMYFHKRSITMSPIYDESNKMKLGHYVSREKGPMDEMYIDLSCYEPRLRTKATAEAIARTWEYCTNADFDWLPNSHIVASMESRLYDKNIVNVLGALVQSGKTKFTILGMYFTALAFGFVPVALVRNIGGGDHITRCEDELQKLQDHIIEHLTEVYDMPRKLLDIFKIKCFDRTRLRKRKSDNERFGNWSCPYVVIDRQNKATVTQLVKLLFDEGNDDLSQNSVLRTDGQRLFRYALFCDEDDEYSGSAGRDRLIVEKESFHTVQDEFLEEEDDLEESIALRDILLNPTVREKCAMLTATSATWFNIVFMDVGSLVPRFLRVPVPHNYKGYFVGQNKIQVYETEEHVKNSRWSALMRDPGIQEMLNHAVKKSEDVEYPHVSVLVNTRAVRQNLAGKRLAADLCKATGKQNISFAFYCSRLISFYVPLAFNNRTELRNMQNDIAKYMQDECKVGIEITGGSEDGELYVFDVKFPPNKRTLARCYDIADAFFDYLGDDCKKFVICVAGALAGRCMTFKTTDHGLPLTHMFLSSMSETTTNYGDVIQTSGRICSVDDLDVQRHLFCPASVYKSIEEGYQVYTELLHLFRRYPNCTYEEAITKLTEEQRMFYYRVVMAQENISKRKYCDTIYEKLASKSIYTRKNPPPLIDAEEEECEFVRGLGLSHTVRCIVEHFVRHSNDGSSLNEMTREIIEDGWAQVYEQGEPRPKPLTPAHFVYERKAGQQPGTNYHDPGTIRDRLRTELKRKKNRIFKPLDVFAGKDGDKQWSLIEVFYKKWLEEVRPRTDNGI